MTWMIAAQFFLMHFINKKFLKELNQPKKVKFHLKSSCCLKRLTIFKSFLLTHNCLMVFVFINRSFRLREAHKIYFHCFRALLRDKRNIRIENSKGARENNFMNRNFLPFIHFLAHPIDHSIINHIGNYTQCRRRSKELKKKFVIQ